MFSIEWDQTKDLINGLKHRVSFAEAQLAFLDPNLVIAEDLAHSATEKRFFGFGKVNDAIMTVRFTYREERVRIIGAGYWRKGRKIYEQKNAEKENA